MKQVSRCQVSRFQSSPLVHSRLDYCNVVFAGLLACDIQRLQSVLNTAVRLVAGSHIYKTYRVSCIMHIQYSASARSGPCTIFAWLRSARAAASSAAAYAYGA